MFTDKLKIRIIITITTKGRERYPRSYPASGYRPKIIHNVVVVVVVVVVINTLYVYLSRTQIYIHRNL